MTAVSLALGAALVTASFGVLAGRKQLTNIDLFLSYRNRVGVPALAASIVATIAGSWILFSPAETATWAGAPGVLGYAVAQGLPILILALFGPKLRVLLPAGYSLTSFAEYRFGRWVAAIVAGASTFYMFIFLSAELTGIAQVYALRYEVPLFLPALIIALIALTYTTLGGLRSSILTDQVQLVAFLPLLGLLFWSVGHDGEGTVAALNRIAETTPDVIGWANPGGWQFAAVLLVGITSANLLDQSFWQRVYAARSNEVVRAGFLVGGLVTIGIILLTGTFGFLAVDRGIIDGGNASIALFALLLTMPEWVFGLALVLATLLVMSSTDSMINGIVSAVWPFMGNRSSLTVARLVTILLAGLAVLVASFGVSVLYLFLLADLICAAIVFPLIYGMFDRRLTPLGAAVAMAGGSVAGSLFFPTPGGASWSGVEANMLTAFSVALLVSATVALIASRFAPKPADLWGSSR
ncbi:MAG: sodium:solute symporter family transporter [Spirochaetaceae bacterium]